MALVEEMRQLLREEPLDLVRAALLLGRLGETGDEAEALSRLEELRAELRSRLRGGPTGKERIEVLNRYLFDELGFRGNTEDYYDPRNSFLDSVLARKTGLPITLSLVYVEVGRGAGLPLAGVGFPGHFLVRYEDESGAVFLDPFHGGRVLEEPDLLDLLHAVSGPSARLDPSLLQPSTEGDILARMLYNLKGIYVSSEDFDKLLQVLDLLLLLRPESPLDLRDRGLLYYELGKFPLARKDLQAYLDLDPSAGDGEVIRAHLRDIESRGSMFR